MPSLSESKRNVMGSPQTQEEMETAISNLKTQKPMVLMGIRVNSINNYQLKYPHV